MSEYGGYIFVLDEFYRASEIEFYIGRDKTFTDTLSITDWHTKRAEIFLLSFDNQTISHISLAHRGNTVATQKRQVRFSNLVEFETPISFSEIQQRLDTRFQSYFINSSKGMGNRVPPKTWENVISTIKSLRPEQAAEINRLELLRGAAPDYLNRISSKTLVEERDAVNLALRMADFNPQEILEWNIPLEDQAIPFLQGLKKAKLTEDQIIAHDAQIFGDWDKLKEYQVGATVFYKDDEKLAVMNVNRHKIEHNLGVDLFYYHQKYDAYVMIQYKRMVEEASGVGYRPTDSSYRSELERMQKVEKLIAEIEEPPIRPLNSYRLHQGFCYFKLCPSVTVEPTSTEMIKGMYLPLDYWELLLKSPDIIGAQGGIRITYDNAGRYLNNTTFTDLVKQGLIGSRLTASEKLTEIIRNSIDEDKSVILATRTKRKFQDR
jgi:hypothetical protein